MSNTLDLTPASKRSTEQTIASNDTNAQSRYMDQYASQRASMTVFELIDAQNVRARSIAAAVDAADLETALARSAAEAPLAAINSLLQMSNIPIEIDVQENEQIIARKNGGAPYSIAELSDGERNALLIAGDVLTAKPGTMLIIDEPERHLHRSIISPLLSLLFEKRRDCSFVIATHDLDLPLDNENARVLLVRSSVYRGSSAQSWEADLLEPGSHLDDDVKRDLIGSRRRILFVEGSEESLDKPLYSLIFPMVSVISKVSCKGVEQAVAGLRSAENLAWLNAWGIVDGDGQSPQRVADLERKSVYALPFYSVESIYYHPTIIEKVGIRWSELTKTDPVGRFESAIKAGVAKVGQHAERMVLKSATKLARDQLLDHLPTVPTVAAHQPVSITIDTAALVAEKKQVLEGHLNSKNWHAIVASCPVRESGALDVIAKALGFQGVRDYEAAVRAMLMDDEEALSFVRGLFGGAYAAMFASDQMPEPVS